MGLFSDSRDDLRHQRRRRAGSRPSRRSLLARSLLAGLLLGPSAICLGEEAASSDNDTYLHMAHLLADGTWYQRSEAADALQAAGTSGRAAGEIVRGALLSAIGQGDWRLAKLAGTTLQAIQPDRLALCSGALSDALTHGGLEDQQQALQLVMSAGAPVSATGQAVAGLAQVPALHIQALRALAAIGGGSPYVIPTLQAALHGTDAASVLTVIAAFGTMAHDAAAIAPDLTSLLGTAAYRAAALDALAELGRNASAAVPQVLAAETAATGEDRQRCMHTLKCIETADLPPTAADVSASCVEGHGTRIPLAVDDPDDPVRALSAAVEAHGAHGQVRVDGMCLVYTAAYGWTGTESLEYRVSDPSHASAHAKVSVSVTADAAPPLLLGIDVSIKDASLLQLYVDKPLEKASAADPSHYQLDQHVLVTQAQLHSDCLGVDLTTSGLRVGQPYAITIHGLRDQAETPVAFDQDHVAFTAAERLPGLHVDWFKDITLTLADGSGTVPCVDFPVGPRPKTENYSARYTGLLCPTTSATYALCTRADDGVRLWLDGKLLIDDWADQAADDRSAQVPLTAGVRYHLRVEYYNHLGEECLQLLWSRPGIPKQIIPAAVLSHQ